MKKNIKVEIRNIREFNNCGSFEIVAEKIYFCKWSVKNGEYTYKTEAPENILCEVKKNI